MSDVVKCLLVDDLPENLLALSELVREDDVEILEARSGTEALEILLVHDVALALLDVQMPDMDGFQLAELMRGSARIRRVPIIFVTAGARDQHRMFRGYESGAVDFLYKPIDPRILKNKASVFFQLDRQRRQLDRQLHERTETLRLNEMFTALLAHDLRNPLSAMMTAAHLIERVAAEPIAKDAALRALSSGRRMGRLIEDMLDLARARVGNGIAIKREDGDLGSLIGPVVLEHQIASPGRPIEVVSKGALRGLWDAERIAQVASNLIGNAVKHGDSRGPIVVSLDGTNSDTVSFCVANDGVIPAERHAGLFDPFKDGQQRVGRSEGLGLGLYIVQQIVIAHAGSIEVRTEDARRTVFRVQLPRGRSLEYAELQLLGGRAAGRSAAE
ncbi:MAG TPA: hybrid sensor histidine kinase/response regulator [Steroidobacteraceae bacterium]|jgi:signal transduction histidine kinase|nr:hybrid sensor histidine kinase/response regulator [Steroidobacteraceae bacterium]